MVEANGIKTRKLVRNICFYIARYVFLIVGCYLLLYPILYIVAGSFKATTDFSDPTVVWIPKHLSLKTLKLAWKTMDYAKSFMYSLIYGMVPTLFQFCTSALAAYGMARFKFKGRFIFSALMFLNLLVPTVMIIIPMYSKMYNFDVFGILGLLSKLFGTNLKPNLLDTPFAFWLPAIFGVGIKGGFFIYIFTQFFKGMPKEIEEAAWIDGAGPYRTFLSIIVPSSGSAAITVFTFATIWNWSDPLLPSMFLSEKFPLSVSLEQMTTMAEYVTKGESQIGFMLSSCLLFLIPVVTFYLIVQKKFTASVVTSGITGT